MPRKAKEKINELNSDEEKIVEKKTKKTKSVASTKTREKNSTTKKSTVKKSVSRKTTTKKAAVSSKVARTKSNKKTVIDKHPVLTTEYYDLPFRYNQTIVKILAQTPNTLFIYWDISDADRESYLEKYGSDFFDVTRPYLMVTNETMHYTFEVEINDFANSWYLHINDANCEYKVELGRKFIVNSNYNTDSSLDNVKTFESYHINDYLYITASNKIEAPNDHILFDKLGSSVFFKNVKTNITEQKNISSLSFLQKIGKVYNIYDLYKEIYQDELVSDEFELNLPSSNSSTFK